MAWLNQDAAEFQLYTLDERSEEFVQIDFRDTGNLESRLVHTFSPGTAIERCQAGIDRMLALIPPAAQHRIEVRAASTTEVRLLLHGLEFARVRHGVATHSFSREDEVTFGAGANETPLLPESEELCRDLCAQLCHSRHSDGMYTDPLFRLRPERWLESKLRCEISELLPGLRDDLVYSQVPALSVGDRGLLDLLTLDRNGRLVVIEIKANEDMHLPLQALDYWIRVRALNNDRQPGTGHSGGRLLSAFERQGYFPGAEVSPLSPRLLLVAPALRIHPANEQVLRYLSPQVEWEFIAVSEFWRRDLNIVFRKHSSDPRQ
jgi:hypothetical protein